MEEADEFIQMNIPLVKRGYIRKLIVHPSLDLVQKTIFIFLFLYDESRIRGTFWSVGE